MKSFFSRILCCLCVIYLAGCGPSQAEIERQARLFKENHQAQLTKLHTDENLIAPRWFLKEYTFYPSTTSDGTQGFYISNLFFRMFLLHLLLWIFVSGVADDERWLGENEPSGITGFVVYFIGNICLLGIWIVLGLVCGVVVPILSPGASIPFFFLGFLLLVLVYTVFVLSRAMMLIDRSRWRFDATNSVIQTTSISSSAGPRISTRSGRALRSMVRALFVAIMSGIGGKIGGWIGGIVVFAISTAICSYFQTTLPDMDTD